MMKRPMYLMPSLPQSYIKDQFYRYPAAELEDRDEEENEANIIQRGSNLLHHLDTHKFMEPDEIHPRVLGELGEALSEPFSIIH